ncbi:MAG: hypothetical protein IPN13_16230 [Bacteroidetes bacterium]|nr:hypothetical protein [Bacteroidota bacterium]
MKKLLFISIFLLGTLVSQAQNASAVFFSENGEAFTVIMNGLRKNDKPETNVKVTGLNEAPYTIRIIFADSTLGVINDKIYAANYKERTYTIKLKNISNTSKGLKKAGVNIGRQLKSGDKEEAAMSQRLHKPQQFQAAAVEHLQEQQLILVLQQMMEAGNFQ